MASGTYLELSDELDGTAHKFFEVSVSGSQVTVFYGAIGSTGQTTTRSFGSSHAAQSEADKMIASRKRKGYEPAVRGLRGASAPKKTTSKAAPVLWRFDTREKAFGVCVNDRGCWVSNEAGRVTLLDTAGHPRREFKLPDAAKCIIADEDWIYVGCDDGNIYDLTGSRPVVAYTLQTSDDILWMDIADAVLAVSDASGQLHVFNHEDDSQWTAISSGERGWMVRCDEIGVYHGHSDGVTMYDWEDGEELWYQPLDGAVLFGWADDSRLIVATNERRVYALSRQGDILFYGQCDASVYCCASDGGRYIFAGDSDRAIYCFDEHGQRIWKLTLDAGSAFSMHYAEGYLYIATTAGQLLCIDLPATGLSQTVSAAPTPATLPTFAPAPTGLTAIDDNIALAATDITGLSTTTDSSGGVVVECYSAGGSYLQVRVVTTGYRQDLPVQFPRNLRVLGERFVVEEVRLSSRGSFYRAFGDIKRLTI
ncbi:MAG: outer membrane protein assembly factor BamB/predicted DNA-binding WGR domain protein [Myxococcota bacterium]|jgi:outer membrane protein assembly factor BamB/predicted DNA-binding WGR domain protein